MNKVSPWTKTDCGCGIYRSIAGKNGNDIENRVAFIEKTPRVRIREYNLGAEREWDDVGNIVGETRRWPEFLDWCCGLKGDGPDDKDSQEWCDKMLVALGYEFEQ